MYQKCKNMYHAKHAFSVRVSPVSVNLNGVKYFQSVWELLQLQILLFHSGQCFLVKLHCCIGSISESQDICKKPYTDAFVLQLLPMQRYYNADEAYPCVQYCQTCIKNHAKGAIK